MPARSCVRGMFCWHRFPLASPLPSTHSAVVPRASLVALGSPLAVSPVSRFVPVWGSPCLPLRSESSLFAGFAGTTGLCDFPCPFIDGLRPWTSHRDPWVPSAHAWTRDLPVLAQDASVHARGLRPRRVRHPSPSRDGWYCLLQKLRHGHPGRLCFRGSIPGLHVPLSTLQAHPRGRAHMTRGHCGWLPLQCLALSSIAPCRFIPARQFHHVKAHAKQGPATVENISLRCRRHNQYEAELVFGPRRRPSLREAA